MVAFIGAVICIIAAVHTGSSRGAAAQQQLSSENQSVYPDSAVPDSAAHTPAAGGSAARASSLGALHGSETPEAPTFNVGLSGVTGLTGHDPAVSRLICTPIPPGQCNTGKFEQQADDPSLYAGEDWGYLRTTAEDLRQTVLQQKDQIQSDQRTIHELTGKLSECEKGLHGRTRRGGPAGLWGGAEDLHLQHMVRDSPDSDTGHILTVRAVDELEQAIAQLQDRIEKLESDIGPFPHNLTDAVTGSGHPDELKSGIPEPPPPLPPHTAEGDMSWTGEDLEGELQKKLDLLDKERKALRLETHKQRQAIDQSIAKLHHRISGLEEVIPGQAFPEGFRLSFPTRTNYMYAAVNQHIPKLHAFTICMWLRPADKGIGTPLSYAVPDQPNEVVLLQGLRTPVELLVNDKVVQLPLNISRGSWQHICVSWSQRGGTWQAFQGGRLRGEGHSLAAGHHIRPGGLLVLGQEQDTVGGGFDSTQALVGEMSQVGVWDRVLSANQVASLSRCSKITQGGVAVWTESQIQVHGGATKDPGEPCSKHSMSSQ
ncbi:neuronal pentraxin-2 [Periophthalmus magnuspinnatus]|uniref:neuronal pentraxin-2 n=1 Tax=Periophthalmus magnuspinnatus TaxID=409849 RepID=UPI00145B1E14|nr:neuronal pentraxin-2 [Periophthalmus magnuspinnatus]